MLQSNQKIIRHKVGLLNLAEELGNVSKACQVMGLSRDTFYRYRDAVEEGGVEALLERTRRVPNPENRYALQCEMQQIVRDGSGVIIPAHRNIIDGKSTRVKGLTKHANGQLGASEYPEFAWIDA